MFNNKKIKQLEQETALLWDGLAKHHKKMAEIEKKAELTKIGESVDENTSLGMALRYLEAIIDYMGIEIYPEFKDDPNYYIQHPQVKVWKARKKNTK